MATVVALRNPANLSAPELLTTMAALQGDPLQHVFTKLDLRSLCCAMQTCQAWKRTGKHSLNVAVKQGHADGSIRLFISATNLQGQMTICGTGWLLKDGPRTPCNFPPITKTIGYIAVSNSCFTVTQRNVL